MNWVSKCFVCHVLPWLRIFTVTNTVHNFVFILYSMKSPESNYLCFFFWKFKKKRVIRCHCRQPHIATNFPSLYRVYHGSKSSLHYFMFCIFFYLFCRCCCHFRCFYCKMSSYGVSLVSFIHVCWKYALIQLLTIKKLAFPWNMPLNPCQT